MGLKAFKHGNFGVVGCATTAVVGTEGLTIVYSLLLGRTPLSAMNNWADEKCNVYIRFTVKAIATQIHKSESVIYNAINELEESNLIERKSGEGSRANRIFVKTITPVSTSPPSEKPEDDTPENKSNILRKTGSQYSEKSETNNNTIKKYNNNIYKKGYRI